MHGKEKVYGSNSVTGLQLERDFSNFYLLADFKIK